MLFKICCKAPYQEDIRCSYNFMEYVYASFNKGKVSKVSNKKFQSNIVKHVKWYGQKHICPKRRR